MSDDNMFQEAGGGTSGDQEETPVEGIGAVSNDLGKEQKSVFRIFASMIEQNEEIKDIKQDQKEMLELFCEQNEKYSPKQIKIGFKFYTQFLADESKTTEQELEREKIIELISEIK